jgi:membrane-associated phospholipid phosphatase
MTVERMGRSWIGVGGDRRIVYSTPISMAVADGPTPSEAGRDSVLTRLDAADRRLSRRISADWPHPAWLARPVGWFSLAGNYGMLWYAIALLPLLTGGRRPLWVLGYVGVAVTAVEMLGYVVKHFVGRRRPSVADPSLANQIPLPTSNSFPSSHASMAMTACWTLGSLYPQWLPVLIVTAVALMFTRVYLGVHYVGDVVGGLLFGLVFGGLYVWLVPAPF